MTRCNSCGTSYEGGPQFCPSCGSPVASSGKETETPSVDSITRGAQSKPRRIGPFVFGGLVLFGLIFFVIYIIPSTHEVIKGQPVVAAPADYDSNGVDMTRVSFHEDGEDLVFSLNDVKNHRLIVFEYTGGKTPRRVMAYVAPDGRLVTAISLSEHCGSNEFLIKNNRIYCARCPSHWDMTTMEAYACCAQYYPDPITSRVVGDEVHVAKRVVEEWAGRL